MARANRVLYTLSIWLICLGGSHGAATARADGDCNGNGQPDPTDVFPCFFAPGGSTPANTDGWSLVLTDIDGDSDLDLVVPHGGSTVNILLNDGLAHYSLGASLTVPGAPSVADVADLDNDGDRDIAVACETNGLAIIENLGAAQFAAPVSYAAGTHPIAVTTGDFNADGYADVVVCNLNSANVSVFLNTGIGTFTPAAAFYVGAYPVDLVAGDVDQDSDVDLAIVIQDLEAVRILLNTGTGAFGLAPLIPVNSYPTALALAHLNGDTYADLVVACYSSVVVALGSAAGGFGTPTFVDVPPYSSALAAGDLDSDGDIDLVTAHGTETISVLAGDGTGHFGTAVLFVVGPHSGDVVSVAVGDVDTDGDQDIMALENFLLNRPIPMLNTFAPLSQDCNDDLIPDECNLVSIFDFSPAIPYIAGNWPNVVHCVDVDNDQDNDIVAVSQSGAVSVLKNAGDGSFSIFSTSHLTLYSALYPPSMTGDFDGDGDIDLVVGGGAAGVFWNDGGALLPASSVLIQEDVTEMAAGDLDGDGDLDMALVTYSPSTLTLLYNDGSGTFLMSTPPILFGVLYPKAISLFDLEGDGDLDILTCQWGTVGRFINAGGGDFVFNVLYYPIFSTNDMAVGDIDGDGYTDLAIVSNVSVHILQNDGAFAFAPMGNYNVGNSPEAVKLVDMDTDGHVDLVASAEGAVHVLRNTGDGTFGDASAFELPRVHFDDVRFDLADLDGDGDVDIAGPNWLYTGRVNVRLSYWVPASVDCNQNGAPDECDVVDGSSADGNTNGVPDECEATIVSANPPLDNPYVAGEQPFRDVLQTGSEAALSQGIGAVGTPNEGDITYAAVTVEFSGPPPVAPAPGNVAVTCSAGASAPCPVVTSANGSGAGPYVLTLSSSIPPGACTSIEFVSIASGEKLSYQYLPGDTNMNGSASAADLGRLVLALQTGEAAIRSNLARFDINRSGAAGPADLLRLVGLLNGVNTLQAWAGVVVATCP